MQPKTHKTHFKILKNFIIQQSLQVLWSSMRKQQKRNIFLILIFVIYKPKQVNLSSDYNPTVSATLTTKELEEGSKIFGKNSLYRPISTYEMQVNSASFALCQDNVSLLGNKKKLFELPKKKVDADSSSESGTEIELELDKCGATAKN